MWIWPSQFTHEQWFEMGGRHILHTAVADLLSSCWGLMKTNVLARVKDAIATQICHIVWSVFPVDLLQVGDLGGEVILT